MLYLLAKTSKTFQSHIPLAATPQAPPLSRALIGWPTRLAQISPCVFTSFSFAARTLKNAGVLARAAAPLVTLAALERATGEGRPNRSV